MNLNFITSINKKILKELVNSQDAIVEKNTFDLSPMAEFKQMSMDVFQSIINKGIMPREKEKSDSIALIDFEGFKYKFYKYADSQEISIIKYPDINVSILDSKFYEFVEDDHLKFESYLKEIMSLIPRQHFYKNDYSYAELHKYGIANNYVHRGVFLYTSDDHLNLCKKFYNCFNKDEKLTVDWLLKNKFVLNDVVSNRHIPELKSMFDNWYNFLIQNKATISKPYCFNDLDNKAYIKSNEKYKLMVQSSQNTIYAYVKENETGRIRVWNSALISNSSIKSILPYHISEKHTYLEAAVSILNPYSYECYPFSLDELDGYNKTPEYYLDNFNSDLNIIFDSFLGYNNRSLHPSNICEDFEILNYINKL